jgi:hypothetical protein
LDLPVEVVTLPSVRFGEFRRVRHVPSIVSLPGLFDAGVGLRGRTPDDLGTAKSEAAFFSETNSSPRITSKLFFNHPKGSVLP